MEHEIGLGTLYDFNKAAMANQKPLTQEQIFSYKEELADYFQAHAGYSTGFYHMLLCREENDYTVFKMRPGRASAIKAVEELGECLHNRGNILSIEKTNSDHLSYEIWVRKDTGDFVYYLFPYDFGVIEC